MISLEDMNRYPQYKELEYAIAAQERGNGYAVEAVEAMLRYAFLQRDISVVAAWVRAFNQPSVRVLQRCRFTHEGTLRRHARDKGDTLCYSILKEEWMEAKKEFKNKEAAYPVSEPLLLCDLYPMAFRYRADSSRFSSLLVKRRKSKMLHPYCMEENYGWGHRKILLCGNRTLSTLSQSFVKKCGGKDGDFLPFPVRL